MNIIDLEPQDILAAWTRGDIDAAYTWLPTLAELKKTGKTLVSSRELATAGKPTAGPRRGVHGVHPGAPGRGRRLAQGGGEGPRS